jgi:hypothetical protein
MPKGWQPTRVIIEPHAEVISRIGGGINIQPEGVYVTTYGDYNHPKDRLTLYPWTKVRRVEFAKVLNDKSEEALR